MAPRLFALSIVIALLAACGAPPAAPAPTSAPAAPAAAAPTDAAPAPAGALACEAGFRPFAHAAGETCVPERPQRIVTTQDQNAMLPLLELGVRPVGSAGLPLEDGNFLFRRVADFDTSGIAFVGSYSQPDLEAIALLQPDLIIGPPFQADIYEALSAIAPTVLIDVHERPLDEALLDFATLVNATERAGKLRAEYQARVAELREALAARRDQLTVSIITPGDDSGQFYNEASGQATGTVVRALDLLRPAPERGPDAYTDYRSIETLPEHGADVMLIISYAGEQRDPVLDGFVGSPILQALGAAQAEQVYVLDGLSVVGAGWSKMGAFLDQLERILLAPELNVDIVRE